MNSNERTNQKKIILFFVWSFPVLFLIDDILGFNGYQFTIAGKSIRIILFCMSVAVLCAYSLFVCVKDKITLIPKRKDKVWIFSMLKPIDYLVMLFIFGNALWATVIPLAVRGEMQYSLKDYSTILVMVLYFPLMFLIRTGRMKLILLEKIVYGLCILLAIWHIVMYIGETISPGFYASYYDFIDIISFGTAVRTEVVYGFGITRVIQTTSLFLLVGIFLAIRYCLRGSYKYLASLVLFTFAICVTYTKSIWFGYAFGLVVYLVPAAFCKRDNQLRRRCLIVFAAAVVTVVALNYTVFDNTIFSRVMNTVSTEESVKQLQSQLDEMLMNNATASTENSNDSAEDPSESHSESKEPTKVSQGEIDKIQNEIWEAKGTQMSLALRGEQNAALLNKWKQSLWLGFGYGSYVEDCIRNTEHPFMYESTLLALVMKLGVAGSLVWVVFILGAAITACVFFWKRERTDLFWWLGLALSYALAVQTNPFLFTFTGFSILLYLMLAMQEKTN